MADIKPIETRYDGHRFRSRLEARWAVFFNARGGMKYQYETEGYIMPNGMSYLPDFSFQDSQGSTTIYAEVKPENYSKDDILKPWIFALYSERPVILLAGLPRVGKFTMILPLGHLQEEVNYGFLITAGEKYAINAATEARFEFGEAG